MRIRRATSLWSWCRPPLLSVSEPLDARRETHGDDAQRGRISAVALAHRSRARRLRRVPDCRVRVRALFDSRSPRLDSGVSAGARPSLSRRRAICGGSSPAAPRPLQVAVLAAVRGHRQRRRGDGARRVDLGVLRRPHACQVARQRAATKDVIRARAKGRRRRRRAVGVRRRRRVTGEVPRRASVAATRARERTRSDIPNAARAPPSARAAGRVVRDW